MPESDTANRAKPRSGRGMGLDAGRFVVPEDFNDPLPNELQQYFDGQAEPEQGDS